jgi:hypothetical protein
VYAPAQEALRIPLMTPADVIVRQLGSEPALSFHVYGEMPPFPARVTEYAAPTVPARLAPVVVIDGAAGTVMVADADLLVSAMEVAVTVTVWADEVAAGAVYVAE